MFVKRLRAERIKNVGKTEKSEKSTEAKTRAVGTSAEG